MGPGCQMGKVKIGVRLTLRYEHDLCTGEHGVNSHQTPQGREDTHWSFPQVFVCYVIRLHRTRSNVDGTPWTPTLQSAYQALSSASKVPGAMHSLHLTIAQ